MEDRFSFLTKTFYFSLYFFLFVSFAFTRSESIALCIDVRGKVNREGGVRTGLIRKGDSIYNGDKIITSKNGFSSIIFHNDKTKTNVYDNTSIKIFYVQKPNGSSYEIALFGGKVIAEMKSQKSLIISAPSTEALATGAHFILEYRNDLLFDDSSHSIFTLLTGRLEIKNEISDQFIYPDAGQTIISTLGGKILQLDTFKNSTIISNSINDFNQ